MDEQVAVALMALAEAIDRLAASNEALIDTIASNLLDEDERPPETYIDGTPR